MLPRLPQKCSLGAAARCCRGRRGSRGRSRRPGQPTAVHIVCALTLVGSGCNSPQKAFQHFHTDIRTFFLIMGRAHWNSCTSRIAEKSQMEKRILGLLCAKKTKQRPLRRPRRFRGRCHCGSGNAAGISLQTDNAWPCAGVPHFLRWAP